MKLVPQNVIIQSLISECSTAPIMLFKAPVSFGLPEVWVVNTMRYCLMQFCQTAVISTTQHESMNHCGR